MGTDTRRAPAADPGLPQPAADGAGAEHYRHRQAADGRGDLLPVRRDLHAVHLQGALGQPEPGSTAELAAGDIIRGRRRCAVVVRSAKTKEVGLRDRRRSAATGQPGLRGGAGVADQRAFAGGPA